MNLETYLGSFGNVEIQDLSKFQQVVARRLCQSWTSIPHVTHHDDVDVTALESFRCVIGEGGRKISPLIFLVKALAIALKSFPDFNASLSEDGKRIIRKRYYHIGIAVDGPLGLLVPVLKNVDTRDLDDLAHELREVSVRARDKGLPVSAMEGGSITISSLGGIGGTGFTPIINPPEVAILGVTKTRTLATWVDGSLEPRQMMPLSLSYDHRVINGADAARFLRYLNDILAEPGVL